MKSVKELLTEYESNPRIKLIDLIKGNKDVPVWVNDYISLSQYFLPREESAPTIEAILYKLSCLPENFDYHGMLQKIAIKRLKFLSSRETTKTKIGGILFATLDVLKSHFIGKGLPYEKIKNDLANKSNRAIQSNRKRIERELINCAYFSLLLIEAKNFNFSVMFSFCLAEQHKVNGQLNAWRQEKSWLLDELVLND